MPTRLKRPAFWRPVGLSLALIGFQAYLGYSAISGQFGFRSQKEIEAEIVELEAKSNALQADIDAVRHRVELFDPSRLDPDVLGERARALLSMSRPTDVIVMVDARSGKPISGSSAELAGN